MAVAEAPASRFRTLPAAKVVAPKIPSTKLYELCVIDVNPVQTVNVPCPSSGQVATFTAYRGTPMQGVDGAITGHVDHGNRQRLTEAECMDVERYVGCHVVVRQKGAGGVYAADDPILRGMTDVAPLAQVLSMLPIEEAEIAAERAPRVSMAG